MLITAYCNRLRLAGYRPSTITHRERCLRAFEASVAPHQLTQAGRLDVEAYLSRPLAPESRRAYRSHLSAFFKWALEEGYVSADPTAKVPAIRVPKASPRPVSHDELRRALDHAGGRMTAWLLLMALGGLRAIEVAALRPEDLTIAQDGQALLFLRETKGGGTATIPAHEFIAQALLALPIRDGLWWKCSANHVSVTVAEHLRASGVNATGHRLRHFAGTEWYRASGHDLLTTARLLRHVSVRTSQVYAQLDPTRPAEVVAAMRTA